MQARQCRYSTLQRSQGTEPSRAKLSCELQRRQIMSDFRNSDPLYRDPNDPMTGNIGYEPASRGNTGWGWIAGAVFLVIVLALAFGAGHEPNNNSRVASNSPTPPAATHPLTLGPQRTNPAAPAAPGLTPPPAPPQSPTADH
jgi:hypothetical protein